MRVGIGPWGTMSRETISVGSAQVPCLTPEGIGPGSFRSILFVESEIDPGIDEQEAPEIFTDLNLDQIVESMTAGRDEYNLKPFFYTPLRDVETVNYRYDVLRDLEGQELAGFIQSFAQEMRRMRVALAQADKLYYKYQKQSWFLDAVEIYCAAVTHLIQNLTQRKCPLARFSWPS